jgi:hypothetical protein
MSSDIHMIKDEIKKCESRIESLKNQLKDVQAERQRWERKLEFVERRGLDYINKCPVEILVEIFHLYLTPRHRRIRTFLLVCKKWYDVVMKTPSLWAQIDLYFPPAPRFDRSFGFIPYIQACKQRSMNLPLNINLDLQDIGNTRDYHSYVLDSLYMWECADCLYDTLSDALDKIDDVHECLAFEKPVKELAKILVSLVGDGSKDMIRWLNVRILLPSDEESIRAIAPACACLGGPMNSLRNLSVEGLDKWLEIASDDEDFQNIPGPYDWSRIERLKARFDISSIPTRCPFLKHLDIDLDTGFNALELSELTSLETLAITTYTYSLEQPTLALNLLRQRNTQHHFPHLHSMSITGYVPEDWFEAFKFDLPSLRYFSMHLLGPGLLSSKPFDTKFPRAFPRTVRFKIGMIHDEDTGIAKLGVWNDVDSRDAAYQILHHFSSAEEVIFSGFDEKMVREVVSDRINSGQQCPTSVYREDRGNFLRIHFGLTDGSP